MSIDAVVNSIEGFPYSGVCIDSHAFFLVKQESSFNLEDVEDFCTKFLDGDFKIGAITGDKQSEGLNKLAAELGLSSFVLGIKTNLLESNPPVSFTFVEDIQEGTSFFNDTTSSLWEENVLVNAPNPGIVVVQVDSQNSPSWTIVDSSLTIESDGFLCRQSESDRCFDRSQNIEGKIDGDKIVVAHKNGQVSRTEGQILCQDSDLDLAVITSSEEVEELAQILFLQNAANDQNSPKDSGYWLGITYNASIDDIINDEITNVEEVIGLIDETINDDIVSDVRDLLVNTKQFPWFGNQPRKELNNEAGIAIKRSGSKILLQMRLLNATGNMVGAICRKNIFSLEDSTSEGEEIGSEEIDDEDEILSFFFVGIFIFLGVIFILFVSLYYQQRVNKKMKAMTTSAPAEELIIPPSINGGVDMGDFEESYFSLRSFQTNNKRSVVGDASVVSYQTVKSRKTQISAVDEANDKKIKSVISNRTEMTEMSRKLLNMSPFIRNINNITELVTFYSKVADFLELRIEKDTNRVVEDEQFQEFNADPIPSIPLNFYIKRLVNGLNLWFNDEDSHIEVDEYIGVRALLLGLHYLKKINVSQPLTYENIHKLVCITLLIAAKFVEDEIITNEFWSDIAGISMEEINNLEQIFCFSLNFNFDIDESEIDISLETFHL